MAQGLRLHPSIVRGVGSILGWGTKIPHGQNIKINKIGIVKYKKIYIYIYIYRYIYIYIYISFKNEII